MSYTIKEKTKLLARVRRIKGQVEAVERALQAEVGCAGVLMLVASVSGAVNALTVELIEDHILNHVVATAHEPDPKRAKGPPRSSMSAFDGKDRRAFDKNSMGLLLCRLFSPEPFGLF
jgi:DNA-binding FrmR family transcriptional regulator